MKKATVLHGKAMDLADRAYLARRRGEKEEALRLAHEAFTLERSAALVLVEHRGEEPSRSVLLRSAATLALDAGELRESERLVGLALAGSPPAEIAEELRDLSERISFERHLVVLRLGSS